MNRTSAVLVLALSAATTASASRYQPEFLPVHDGFGSRAFVKSLSDSGLALVEHPVIGGTSNFSVLKNSKVHYTLPQPLQGESRFLNNINDEGLVAGVGGFGSTVGNNRAIIGSKDGVRFAVDTPSGGRSINNRGEVAGSVVVGLSARPAIFRNGESVRLEAPDAPGEVVDINDNGMAVGYWYSTSQFVQIPIAWDNGKPLDLGRQGFIYPTRVNNRGQILGSIAERLPGFNNWKYRPALWFNGQLTVIPGDHSQENLETLDLNEHGDAIYSLNNFNEQTFTFSDYEWRVWLEGKNYRLEELLVPGFDDNEFAATSINSSRWIGGLARNRITGDYLPVLFKPVPEPGTLVGVAAGLALLIRRRRNPR